MPIMKSNFIFHESFYKTENPTFRQYTRQVVDIYFFTERKNYNTYQPVCHSIIPDLDTAQWRLFDKCTCSPDLLTVYQS